MTKHCIVFGLSICAAFATACDRTVEVEEPFAPAPDEEIDQGPAVIAAPFYIGVWAGEPGLCDVAPGTTDPGPIEITVDEMIGYENRCVITEAIEGTDGGYSLSMRCTGQGVTVGEIVEVDVDGEKLRMRRGGGAIVELYRCNTTAGGSQE